VDNLVYVVENSRGHHYLWKGTKILPHPLWTRFPLRE